MKRISNKRRSREAKAKPVRQALIASVGRCEVCGHDPRRVRSGSIGWNLSVHEIANGPNRQKALDQRYAVLVACWLCNGDALEDRKAWPEARQLAALRRSRPKDYDLSAYNALVGRGPNRITESEVLAAERSLP